MIAPHSQRTFVERSISRHQRRPHDAVITDLGVLEPVDGELTLTTLHPGVTVEQVQEATGWDWMVADMGVGGADRRGARSAQGAGRDAEHSREKMSSR